MSWKSPKRESAERAAETIPGLSAAAAAVGLQDHQRMLHQHAQRLKDTYEMGKAAFTGEKQQQPSGDEIGDILITGDIKVGAEEDAAAVINAIRGELQPQNETPASLPAPRRAPIGLICSTILAAAATIAGSIVYVNQPNATPPKQNSNVDVGFGEPTYVEAK